MTTLLFPAALAPYTAATGSRCSPRFDSEASISAPGIDLSEECATNESSAASRNDRKLLNRNDTNMKWLLVGI